MVTGKALRKKILSHLKNNENRDYDCVLGFSGGRDSSYLLYYLVTVLNLRVLAFAVDNGFIPEQTITNVERISNLLNVDLVIEKKIIYKNVLDIIFHLGLLTPLSP